MNRGIALLGLVVVRTATARFLRGLAEHSPANVTAANYTRCVFERRDMVECHSTRGEELFSKDEAFAQCDADPECGAVQKWKKNIGEGKSTRYKLCSPRKDACGRPRLEKYERDGCSEGENANSESEEGVEDCSVYRVFTCPPYDKRPAMRSEGLFALCIIMSFVCPLLICISTAAAAGAAEEGNPLICFFCPLLVFWILTFAFLSAYYGPARNHSRDGACDPRVQPWGTHGAAIVGYGVIATGTLLCCIARPSLCCDDGCCVADPATPPQQREREKDLWQACSKGDVTAVRRLLKKGADVNQATENGQTPLFIACFNGHVDAARLMLDKGAEVDRANVGGVTPLWIACSEGHVNAVRLLLKRGAEVDRAIMDGTTPLWIACQEGHVDVARLLLEEGADAGRLAIKGTTPLDIAQMSKAIVELFDEMALYDDDGSKETGVEETKSASGRRWHGVARAPRRSERAKGHERDLVHELRDYETSGGDLDAIRQHIDDAASARVWDMFLTNYKCFVRTA